MSDLQRAPTLRTGHGSTGGGIIVWFIDKGGGPNSVLQPSVFISILASMLTQLSFVIEVTPQVGVSYQYWSLSPEGRTEIS